MLLCAALVTQLFNSFIHTIDGWTAVAWTGMTLSVIGAVLAVAATAVLYRVPFAWAEYREERP